MITLLHTNDVHGHLTPWTGWEGELKGKTVGGLGRLAGAVAQARRELGENVLLLDAGDLIGDTMIADLTQGKALITAWNHLGYDAFTIGNHEPDFGMQVLRERIDDATFPAVAANLVEREGSKPFTKPYIIKEVAGVPIGILGLAYPKTARTTVAKNIAEVEFEDPASAVERYLPTMRQDGAALAVVLSHLGLSGDKNLARSIDGIDVIVGGHSHNRMHKAELVNGTLIVQAGAHGSDLGRLDLIVEKGKITDHRRSLIPLDHDKVPADADAERLVEELLEPHRKVLDEVVGEAGAWLVRAQTLAGQEARKRDEESPVDSLFADIVRSETGADIAFLPGVGYGVAIPPGPIKAASLRQLLPHDSPVITMQLAGLQIIEILEQAVANAHSDDPAVKVGGMIQISGLRFEYNPAQPAGHRIVSLERTSGRWEPNRDYTVVTNSLLAHCGHNYESFRRASDVRTGKPQYETVKQWFGQHSPISTPPLGRIKKTMTRTQR